MEFLDISSLGVAYRYVQNQAEDQTKDVTIWAWEPLTIKARKGWPKPTKQRTEKRWIVSGQPIQAASQKVPKVVRLP
jgi:hypothetical protein